MSNRLRYILSIIVLVVAMLGLQLVKPSHFDWTPTFGHEDSNPFGCMVFDSVMAQTMPQGYHASGATLRQTVQDTVRNNVLIVSREGTLTQANVNDIQKLLSRGVTVMLVGFDFFNDSPATKAFSIRSTSYARFYYKGIARQLAEGDNAVYDTLYYHASGYSPKQKIKQAVPACIDYKSNHYRIYTQLLRGRVEVDDTFFLNKNNLYTIGYTKHYDYDNPKEYDKCYHAMMLTVGKGRLVVVSSPLLFTNFSILDQHTHPYVMRLMNTLADRHVVRLDETLAAGAVTGDAADKHNASPLSYILSQPPLRWAYYMLLVGIVLLFVFGTKRRQRVIPVIHGKKNHDLEFVKLIGKLYYERHDNADLVLKKYNMMVQQVRTSIDVDLTDRRTRTDNIHTLSMTINIKPAVISALLSEVEDIHNHQLKVSDTDMIRLVDQIDAILKNIIKAN